MTDARTPAPWNATAVPVGAAMFLVAEVALYAFFGNPRSALSVVTVWFLVAFVVQFWGSRSDRITALAALVLMAVVAYLLVVLGG